MKKQKDSIAKGGAALVLSRVLGMLCSFVFFIYLARQSVTDAGVFRTAYSYLLVAEFLGMLGMLRWLTTEMAKRDAKPAEDFFAMLACSLVGCLLMGLLFFTIAQSHLYSSAISIAIQWVCLGVLACGIYDCVQAAYIGLGHNKEVALLNVAENVLRSGIAFVMLASGYSVYAVIIVFVVMRWLVAMFGFYRICLLLSDNPQTKLTLPHLASLKRVLNTTPTFLTITVATTLLRNLGALLLPVFHREADVAYYAVGFQLLDLLLALPSLLAISANRLFVQKAQTSNSALKKVTYSLLYFSLTTMMPFAVCAMVMASPLITFLYGDAYAPATVTLVWLMITAMLMIVEQGLSQVMLAKSLYQKDMQSALYTAVFAVCVALPLAYLYTHQGMAIAMCLSTLFGVIYRLHVLKRLLRLSALVHLSWRALIAGLVMGLAGWMLNSALSASVVDMRWALLGAPLLLGIYLLSLKLLGGMNIAKLTRLKLFLAYK